ncbi:MAG: substrate-binding domain-containing protein [Thermoplasmataceae archaeon]
MKNLSAAITAIIVVAVLVSSVVLLDNGLLGNKNSGLITYTADAYTIEAEYLLNSFHNATGAQVEPVTSGGSYADAEEIANGHPASVFLSVALNSYDRSYLGPRYSGWAIAFAADQIVLAYNSSIISGSSPADGIAQSIVKEFQTANLTNSSTEYRQAFANLTSGVVKIGISNPNEDPAGVRAYTSLEIAGSIFENDVSYYLQRMQENHSNVTASNAASLVAPLDVGQIQFLYIYKSAAILHDLKYIALPDFLNFGSENKSAFYGEYYYNISTGEVRGSPIYLFISTIANNTDASVADNFVTYVVKNSSNLSRFGLVPLSQSLLFSNVTVPAWLDNLQNQGVIRNAGGLT